jgi:hypothetical protein|tara:strand:- start:1248 stop:1409 length:162 start_codon:yes stop_codon:yes gene_type:complete
MNRSEVITGIQALRYELEKANFSDNTIDYYDEVLQQCRLAVLLNEQNDPHSRY